MGLNPSKKEKYYSRISPRWPRGSESAQGVVDRVHALMATLAHELAVRGFIRAAAGGRFLVMKLRARRAASPELGTRVARALTHAVRSLTHVAPANVTECPQARNTRPTLRSYDDCNSSLPVDLKSLTP
jgi:hypothetical protein